MFEADASVKIRVLDSADAGEFQRLRLQALEESPAAFYSSPEQEAGTPLTEIAQRLKPNPDFSWILGALTDGGELIGMLGFRRDPSPKHAHKAIL